MMRLQCAVSAWLNLTRHDGMFRSKANIRAAHDPGSKDAPGTGIVGGGERLRLSSHVPQRLRSGLAS